MKNLLTTALLALALGFTYEVSAQNSPTPTPPPFTNVVPRPVAVRVIHAAHPLLQPVTNLSLGQMIQQYNQGNVIVVELGRDLIDPRVGIYSVTLGGNTVSVALEDTF